MEIRLKRNESLEVPAVENVFDARGRAALKVFPSCGQPRADNGATNLHLLVENTSGIADRNPR